MRTIQTFVLRLLVDAEEPRALRGTVRSVAGGQEHTFTDGQSLLAWLRDCIGHASRDGVEGCEHEGRQTDEPLRS